MAPLKRESQKIQTLYNINNSLHGNPPNLVSRDMKELIREGPVHVVSDKKVKKKCYMYLFDKELVLTEVNTITDEKVFDSLYSLAGCELKDIADNSAYGTGLLQITIQGGKKVIFSFFTSEEKKSWFQDIKRIISKMPKKVTKDSPTSTKDYIRHEHERVIKVTPPKSPNPPLKTRLQSLIPKDTDFNPTRMGLEEKIPSMKFRQALCKQHSRRTLECMLEPFDKKRIVLTPLATKELLHIEGPDIQDQEQERFTDVVAARTVSTFPYSTEKAKRDGDPIADCYRFLAYKNRMVAVLTDGCGSGTRPLLAAYKCATTMINEMKQSQNNQSITLRDVVFQLLRAASKSHDAILDGRKEIWEAGTTTLLAGVLMEVERQTTPHNNEWWFTCLSVGNCKAFHVSKKNKVVTDITYGNTDSTIPGDPGGRLGPYMFSGTPDLRNLMVYDISCDLDDMILITSHGVHENFDPENNGLTPLEALREAEYTETLSERETQEAQSWATLDPVTSQSYKNSYRSHKLTKLINGIKPPITPRIVTKNIIDYCTRNTQSVREYMELNPNTRYPNDHKLYPGMMEHSTCITFQVERIYRS
eukprot:TRINITY_DN4586_c0_g1_i1.p1 TRINITY_DN4586_c0_g1~~TRINITY_DN4586_c0_g1_i1.p1  ORF type:complete len:604 (-),score=86.68 TRINITY_DN4586_c0_g1_i1:60-1823(-)